MTWRRRWNAPRLWWWRSTDAPASLRAASCGAPGWWSPPSTPSSAMRISASLWLTAASSPRRSPAAIPGTDLAVLKIDDAGAAAPEFAPADSVKTGNLALAVARSADLGANATMGVISAVGGAWSTWRGGRVDQYIRLDVSLYPGSSGGAVVDTAGPRCSASPLRRSPAPPAWPFRRRPWSASPPNCLTKGRIPRGYLGRRPSTGSPSRASHK